MTLKLVIGNKNYSSWSLRPWIAMRATEIPFDETLIPFGDPDFKARVLETSPVGKVPVLLDGDVHVWESLAILEYLAEKFSDAELWPSDPKARAHARAIASEMHAGFGPLRSHCPMNMRRPVIKRELPPEAEANVRRIDSMWTQCRGSYGAGGPFLFGGFSAADAMYAPMVARFTTYAAEVGPESRAYMDAVRTLPAYEEWKAAGLKESWVVAEDEVDWPTVLKA
jgi:glutathione S-transferase